VTVRHDVSTSAKLAAACGTSAAALALAVPVVASAARPGYDHCRQFISELGESGAPHAALVSYAGFLPIGVLTILFAVFAGRSLAPRLRARLGLALFSGVGWAYVVAAFFPCDPGCPTSGSATQSVHSASGLVEYLGGGLGLLLLATSFGRARSRASFPSRLSLVCAAIVLGAFVAMLLPPLEGARGLVQRAAETALFVWMLAVSRTLWGSGDASPSN